MIPAVPLRGHFRYLGKIFDFQALNSVPKKDFGTKMNKILVKISSLGARSQTKLKIFSVYVPSQFNFELKLYDFTDAFLSGIVDRLCTKHIREWLEFPPSSCVTEWASSPTNFMWARNSDLCTESGQNETDQAPSSPFQQEPEHQGTMGGLQRPECHSGFSTGRSGRQAGLQRTKGLSG